MSQTQCAATQPSLRSAPASLLQLWLLLATLSSSLAFLVLSVSAPPEKPAGGA